MYLQKKVLKYVFTRCLFPIKQAMIRALCKMSNDIFIISIFYRIRYAITED